jgi:hypothetical protein
LKGLRRIKVERGLERLREAEGVELANQRLVNQPRAGGLKRLKVAIK